MILDDDYVFETEDCDELMHYGVKRRSGRYEWGSGDVPYQHEPWFLSRVGEYQAQGLSEKEMADKFGTSVQDLRLKVKIAKHRERNAQVSRAKDLLAKGDGYSEIGRKMGLAPTSVKALLDPEIQARKNVAFDTAKWLEKQVDERGIIEIGKGVAKQHGLTEDRWKEVLAIAEEDGYFNFQGRVDTGKKSKATTISVITPPGTEYIDYGNGKRTSAAVYKLGDIHPLKEEIFDSNTETFKPAFQKPSSINHDRVAIRYSDDPKQSGTEKDGVIEIRRGVADLDLGKSHYAQVRILVDGTHYLKGMAIYSDNLPEGKDILFNTNKPSSKSWDKVLKEVKRKPDGEVDWENPFGALIKENGGQSSYIDKDGTEKLSAINKTREEGDWDTWSSTVPSQFLSKQPLKLAEKQLKLSMDEKQAEYDEISAINNPEVKKYQLQEFANACDRTSVHLEAASFPRQSYRVILPVPSLKDNEVYAPTYKDGETVALIRYPHGGTFEIPIVKVNNKHKEGTDVIGPYSQDAIGINPKVAAQLSGADFDGDTVMVIPCNSSTSSVNINATRPLEELADFDPKLAYGGKEPGTFKMLTEGSPKQKQMGIASNLITDMTIKGASASELARAVKYSMVVIDAPKHKLDWQQCYSDCDIQTLKDRYQSKGDDKKGGGASTLISRAKSKVYVDKRQGEGHTNIPTSPYYDPTKPIGSIVYKTADKQYNEFVDPETGKVTYKKRQDESTQMQEASDARSLISDYNSPMEQIYAQYANYMKSMANKARLDILATKSKAYDPSAAKVYSKEVSELKAQLNEALKNAPRERMAQIEAAAAVKQARYENPEIGEKDVGKVRQRALVNARAKYGAKGTKIRFTDKQWEAIQAGAISSTALRSILLKADADRVAELSSPKQRTAIGDAKAAKINNMLSSGYTISEIASSVGLSTSALSEFLRGGKK